jgi:hypothetical protein
MIIALAIGVPLVITLGILVANRRKGPGNPARGTGKPASNSGDTSSGYIPGVTDSTGSLHRDASQPGTSHPAPHTSESCGHGDSGGSDSGAGDSGAGGDGGGGGGSD